MSFLSFLPLEMEKQLQALDKEFTNLEDVQAYARKQVNAKRDLPKVGIDNV